MSPHPACLLPAWHTPTVFVSTNLNCQLDFSFSSPTFVTICCNLISRSLVSNTKNVAGSTGRYSSFLHGVQRLTLLNQRLTLLNQHLEVNRPISPKFLLTYLVGQQQINNSTTTMCSFALTMISYTQVCNILCNLVTFRFVESIGLEAILELWCFSQVEKAVDPTSWPLVPQATPWPLCLGKFALDSFPARLPALKTSQKGLTCAFLPTFETLCLFQVTVLFWGIL